MASGVVIGSRSCCRKRPAVAASHIAIYKLGAIALPLAILFGNEAISYRLQDSGARALITNAQGLEKLAGARAAMPDLELVLSVDGAADGAEDFHAVLARAADEFTPVATGSDDPALMVYTSGTTGPPKGALHAHRVLIGHLPGIEFPHEFLPQPGDRFWTPADWAWAGGLLNVLLPALHYGVPVVAQKVEKFDPGEAYRADGADERAQRLHPADGAADAALGAASEGGHRACARSARAARRSAPRPLNGASRRSGVTINEFYGQTECNLVLASCAALGVSRAGAIGKPVPGHTVAVIRPDGAQCAPGELGQIAIRRPDPVMFLEYWGKPDATRDKFIGDWMTTGDQGVTDAEGYVQFIGRDDDVITSAGYRIGPTEIEDCLIRHPAVALAAVVGKPDPVRTEIVKAFIVLKSGQAPSDALAADIKGFVRTRLSAHEYPREVAFIEHMPMTTTGKVIRRLLRERA